jgi:P pilus assembly chaperone PapD
MKAYTIISASLLSLVLNGLIVNEASASVALDRTRVIVNGDASTSLTVRNENKELPYLAQAWIEDAAGKKITSPMVVLPPLQRLEPGATSQFKVEVLPAGKALPQDRETLFYFNLREIPPRSKKSNTLQIALQTRVKLFYRPVSLAVDKTGKAELWQEKMTLTRSGSGYLINNPTPYYITVVGASSQLKGDDVAGFKPVMIPPNGQAPLAGSLTALGSSPVLTYVNDFGGRPQLTFGCHESICQVVGSHK